MTKKSAGILLYRVRQGRPEVFLVHPGGPFFKNKDAGAWTIPKGEFQEEDPLAAAIREFQEETGTVPSGPFTALQPVKQKSGKWVYGWAMQGDIDASAIRSNSFELEWPPKSGKLMQFPEVDRGAWFDFPTAKEKILPAQSALLDELNALIGR